MVDDGIRGWRVGGTDGYLIQRARAGSRESNHAARPALSRRVTYLTVVRAPILYGSESSASESRHAHCRCLDAFPVDSPTRLRRHRAGRLGSRRGPGRPRATRSPSSPPVTRTPPPSFASLYRRPQWPPDLLTDVEHVSLGASPRPPSSRSISCTSIRPRRSPSARLDARSSPRVYAAPSRTSRRCPSCTRLTPRSSTWPSRRTSAPASPPGATAGSSTMGWTSAATPGPDAADLRLFPRTARREVKGAHTAIDAAATGRAADPGCGTGPPA